MEQAKTITDKELIEKIKQIVKEECVRLDNMNEWGVGATFNSRVLERLEKVLEKGE